MQLRPGTLLRFRVPPRRRLQMLVRWHPRNRRQSKRRQRSRPSTARWLTSDMLPPSSVELRTAAETTSFTTGRPTLATRSVLSITPMTASRTKPVASPVISSVARNSAVYSIYCGAARAGAESLCATDRRCQTEQVESFRRWAFQWQCLALISKIVTVLIVYQQMLQRGTTG